MTRRIQLISNVIFVNHRYDLDSGLRDSIETKHQMWVSNA